MKENKLNFETEKLILHWLKISIEELYYLEKIQMFDNHFDKKLELNFTFQESYKPL